MSGIITPGGVPDLKAKKQRKVQSLGLEGGALP